MSQELETIELLSANIHDRLLPNRNYYTLRPSSELKRALNKIAEEIIKTGFVEKYS